MTTSYSLLLVWHERTRYFPAILAVNFSALLIILQFGILLGMLSIASRPIDRTRADLWVGARDMGCFGFSQPVPVVWKSRLLGRPEVKWAEPYLCGFGMWKKPAGDTEQCYIIGSSLEDESLGAIQDLSLAMRRSLAKPGAVGVFEPDLALLGLKRGGGETAEVAGQRVEVAAIMRGSDIKGAGLQPGLFCSLRTARILLSANVRSEQVMYLLAQCRDPGQSDSVAEQLRHRYPDMEVLTREGFSRRTWVYWLTKTKAGVALAFAAVLGLMFGALIIGQTLYAATAASAREYAVLQALGISRRRINALVLAQAFWVAVVGIVLALPISFGLAWIAGYFGVELPLPAWLLVASSTVTLVTALFSGLGALRSLRLAEPVSLLR